MFGYLPSFNNNFRITGTFFNPAPFALYLAVVFPLALFNIILKEEIKFKNNKRTNNRIVAYLQSSYQFFIINLPTFNYYFSFVAVIAILIILPITKVRAAWVTVLVGTFAILNYKYHFFTLTKKFLNTKMKKLMSLALVFVIFSYLGLGLYRIKKGSSVGKLLIWEVTLGKISEKVLFGYGVGKFEAEYNNWQAEYFQKHTDEMNEPKGMAAGNTKYCFNEFLEVTSETGISGLFLFLFLLAIVLKETNKIADTPFLSFFISFTTTLIFSFSLYSLSTLILFFPLLALITTYLKPIYKLDFSYFFSKRIRLIIALGLLICTVKVVAHGKQQCEGYYYWDEADLIYNTQNYQQACKSFAKVYKQMRYNGDFLGYYGTALNLNKDFKKSDSLLREAQLFFTSDALFITKGNNFLKLKKYDLAEEAYRKANYVTPCKQYPLYLLAKLYMQKGEIERARNLALKLVNKPLKIKTEANMDMIQEMTIFISSIKKKGEVY
jgi:hypothetical protein